MGLFELLVYAGVIYVIADFALGMALRRCIMPGLKCRACRERPTGGGHGD